MKKLLLLALLAASSLSACKKDKEDAKPKTKSEIIVDKKWRINAATASFTANGRPTTQDLLPFIDDCEKDNFTTYKGDKSFVDDNGPTKCDPTDSQTQNGTWDLSSDQSKILITYPGQSTETANLTELTGTTMVWEQEDTDPQVGNVKIKITFKPI